MSRVAVVSGAARGIGRVLAEGLAAEGASVAAVDISNSDDTAEAIRAAGGTCRSFVCDVADEGAVHGLHRARFADLDYATWRRFIRTNLDSRRRDRHRSRCASSRATPPRS